MLTSLADGLGVRLASLNVHGVHPLVKDEGVVEGLHDGVRRAGEAPAPQLLGRGGTTLCVGCASGSIQTAACWGHAFFWVTERAYVRHASYVPCCSTA